jgi:ABC-type transport system involved in multi-copper enzyme maturation permease subunit
MPHFLRNIGLIAGTLLLEAWRRKEIYVIVFVTTALLVGLRFVQFFEMEGLGKFYREISLKAMNVTTALTVILLSARQLPREFSLRTIYPLLAKPIGRFEFLLGKFIGVMLAGMFCYGLFMAVFLLGSLTLRAPVQHTLFVQSVYLQLLSLAVVAALSFLVSMIANTDAAITLSALLYISSQILMNLMSEIYDYVGAAQRAFLLALHYIIPQLTLFDASAKVIHSVDEGQVVWGPLSVRVMTTLTLYALAYMSLYLGLAWLFFRRKPL